MNVSTSAFKRFRRKTLLLDILSLLIFSTLLYQTVFNVQARKLDYLQVSDSNYENEIELEYGIPIEIVAEDSVPSSTILEGFYIRANFSSNNGSIWINDQNGDKIWNDTLSHTIETNVGLNNTSIKKYSLWANSSTLGNNTLFFTFRAQMIVLDNFGLMVPMLLIILIPIVIIVIIVVEKGRTKDSHSVRIAKRVGERLAVKFENKSKGKFTKLFRDKPIIKKVNGCPKCGIKIATVNDKFCKNCGFRLRD